VSCSLKCSACGKALEHSAVDDEFGVAHALAFALSNPARQLTLAFSADEALARVTHHSQSFDVVIIDHRCENVGDRVSPAVRG